MDINLARLASGDLCEIAKERWHKLHLLRLVWDGVILGVGAVLAATICIGLLTSLDGENVAAKGIITLVGLVVEGGALIWLSSQKKESVRAENGAYEDFKRQCGPEEADIRGKGRRR